MCDVFFWAALLAVAFPAPLVVVGLWVTELLAQRRVRIERE